MCKRVVGFVVFLLLGTACEDIEFRSVSHFMEVMDRKVVSTQYVIDKINETDSDFARQLAELVPDKEIIIESIRYKTEGPDGTRERASGIIARPVTDTIKGVVSALHATITELDQAPSELLFSPEVFAAFFDYVVIISDYLGYGVSSALIHPYLHIESTARVQMDMVEAAREHLLYDERIDIGKDLYVLGYSQGGAAALGFQKMVERDYAGRYNIKQVLCGGVPLDLIGILDDAVSTHFNGIPAGVVMVPLGLDQAEHLQLDYDSIFTGRLLTHYEEWILSKQYSVDEIKDSIGTATDAFLHPDFFSEAKNTHILRLMEAADRNSLYKGWTPKAPIYMMHGFFDEAIPYQVTKDGAEYMEAQGAVIDFHTNPLGGHRLTAGVFFIAVCRKLIDIASQE